MKYIFSIYFLLLVLTCHAQDTIRKTFLGKPVTKPLDTNEVIYDVNGKALRYYQYQKLLNSGEYTIRQIQKTGSPMSKPMLVKLSPQEQIQRYDLIKLPIKSPKLQEGMALDIQPLLETLTDAELDNKVIVLVFWNSECPPCTESFSDINLLFKQVHNPEDVVILAITTDSKEKAQEKLKQKPLLYAQLLSNAGSIFKTYQLNAYPSYVVADKKHIIRYSTTGAAPFTIPKLKNTVRAVLQQ